MKTPNPPPAKTTKTALAGAGWLLFPFACLYDAVTRLRNWLYDNGWLKSCSFPVKTIVVGNLTVGGTGKTPHVEYLIRLLKGRNTIATLSRGYGRRTKGFLVAGNGSDARQIGDEPMQFYRKFGHEITVTVGENRVAAIQKLMQHPKLGGQNSIPEKAETSFDSAIRNPPPTIIVLDDAFQHRPVRPVFSILLTDYNRLFYNDFVLPAGRLRESRTGARRADCIIVSKCPPGLAAAESQAIATRIGEYAAPGTPVFFTSISYGDPVGFGFSKDTVSNTVSPGKVILVSGIARSQPLEIYVGANFGLQRHLAFADHHDYTPADVEKIRRTSRETGVQTVLATEKDFVKLTQLDLPPEIAFFYLPIEIYFLFGEEAKFDRLVSGITQTV